MQMFTIRVIGIVLWDEGYQGASLQIFRTSQWHAGNPNLQEKALCGVDFPPKWETIWQNIEPGVAFVWILAIVS